MPVDGQESFLKRLQNEPPPPPPAPTPGGPDAWYLMGNATPDDWIPLLPVTARDGSLMLRTHRQRVRGFRLLGELLAGVKFVDGVDARPRIHTERSI